MGMEFLSGPNKIPSGKGVGVLIYQDPEVSTRDAGQTSAVE